jgi:hypothetical protein
VSRQTGPSGRVSRLKVKKLGEHTTSDVSYSEGSKDKGWKPDLVCGVRFVYHHDFGFFDLSYLVNFINEESAYEKTRPRSLPSARARRDRP